MIPSEKLFCVHKVHDQKFDFDYFGSENVEGFNFTQIKNTHLASLKEKLPAIGWKKKTIKKIFEKTNSFRVRKRFRSFFFFLETVSPGKVFIQSWVATKDIPSQYMERRMRLSVSS